MVTGKEFRVSIGKGKKKLRVVQPFSQQALQPNTKVIPPPSLHVFCERPVSTTIFRKYFDRGDIPIARAMQKGTKPSTVLMWRLPPQTLDYAYYLPIFFEGLAESNLPYKLLARSGVHDMLAVDFACYSTTHHSNKKCPEYENQRCCRCNYVGYSAAHNDCLDNIKSKLYNVFDLIIQGPNIGKALVPYFRQILPIFNLMRDINANIGDKIEFNALESVGDIVNKTLQMLEKMGGPDAFINIKYMVPTYESSVFNG